MADLPMTAYADQAASAAIQHLFLQACREMSRCTTDLNLSVAMAAFDCQQLTPDWNAKAAVARHEAMSRFMAASTAVLTPAQFLQSRALAERVTDPSQRGS